MPPEALRLTPLQKDRLRNNEIFIELPEPKRERLPNIEKDLDSFENLVGAKAANRLGSLLACTEYGLSETEILELIMPTGEDNPLSLDSGQFNFATWCLVRRTLDPWLKVSITIYVVLQYNFYSFLFFIFLNINLSKLDCCKNVKLIL